ncbi:MAG: hypothetical protein FJW36_17910 [Acidobacteria bacterium]|nr:hypothetical protein [Acidobacteriota bacterium]
MQSATFLKQIIGAIPWGISAGVVAGAALLPHAAGQAAAPDALVAGLAGNLIATAITAFCNQRCFTAEGDHEKLLANHDIRRIVTQSWQHAIHACLQTVPDQENYPHLASLKPDEIELQDLSLETITDTVAAARRGLLAEPGFDSTWPKEMAAWAAEQLQKVTKEHVSDAVVDHLAQHLVSQLCLYTAAQLKSDELARIAVAHFSQQKIEDAVARIDETITTLAQNGLKLSDAEFQRIEKLFAGQRDWFDQRIARENAPELDFPFADVRGTGAEFTFRRRKTILVGRDEALGALRRFLADDRPVLWTVVSGPAGTGKSRLAAELVAMVRSQNQDKAEPLGPLEWRSGFVNASRTWLEDSYESSRWHPDSDTLLVLDYAGDLAPKRLAEFLATVNPPPKLAGIVKVRLLLVDRTGPTEKLGLVERLNDGRCEARR